MSKNLFMDFTTDLSISANKEDDCYALTLVIIEPRTKIVYYKSVKVTIDVLSLTQIIMNVIVHQCHDPQTNHIL